MLLVLAYILIGLAGSRSVRGRVRLGIMPFEEECHETTCSRRRSADAKCSYTSLCKQGYYDHHWANLWLVLGTPLLWPFYLLGWFMLAEKLPELPHRETADEKFQKQLANDPVFRETYENLTKQYGIGV